MRIYGFTQNTGQKQEPLAADDITAMIARRVGQLVPMDEETSEPFRQLAKKMNEQAGNEHEN